LQLPRTALCGIVAEIPLPELGGAYGQARAALRALLRGHRRTKSGVLREPVEVRLVGAAFFDGHHRAGGRRNPRVAPPHGRCNSSLRALWEIQPVYRVVPPGRGGAHTRSTCGRATWST